MKTPNKILKNAYLLTFSFALVAITACVTVNVNFPESSVQKATDEFVRELYRARDKDKPAKSEEKSEEKSSFLRQLDAIELFPTAHAADGAISGEIHLDSSKAMKIKEQMAGRVNEIITQKKAGFLGETNEGTLVLRGAADMKPILKKKLEKLVADENKDREALYSDFADENQMSSKNAKAIKRSFTRSFQGESPSGTWVQDPDGKWAQKP